MVCGVDEAGRGPIAGPVIAAAVILDPANSTISPAVPIADSKKLTPEQRDVAAQLIRRHALAWATGWVWPEEIDRINIHNAALLAMTRAVGALTVPPGCVLVDGRFAPPVHNPCRAIVRGDTFVLQIMAASIMAKTERDRWMIAYSRIEPRYSFQKHKGYPTPEHRRLLNLFGFTPIHRRSFRLDLSGKSVLGNWPRVPWTP